jgi:hypothetical protein
MRVGRIVSVTGDVTWGIVRLSGGVSGYALIRARSTRIPVGMWKSRGNIKRALETESLAEYAHTEGKGNDNRHAGYSGW